MFASPYRFVQYPRKIFPPHLLTIPGAPLSSLRKRNIAKRPAGAVAGKPESGSEAAPAAAPQQGSPLLSACIAEYLAHVRADFSRKTYESYALVLKTLFGFTGDVEVGCVTAHVLDRFKVARIGQVSKATVNLELRSIKAFFNCLVRWEIVASSPCDSVRMIRGEETPPAFLTEDDLARLLDTLGGHWIRPIVIFAVMTGARLGEILNLDWADVDLERRVVCIRSSAAYRVKGGKMRLVPLNDTVVEMLGAFPHREGLVFRGVKGGHANANHVSKTFRYAVRAAGLNRRIHFHSTRHSFASALVLKGASLFQVQKLLGHSSPAITMVYSHLQGTQMHDVVNLISIKGSR